MAERILHPSYSLQVPKEWMIRAVSMKGELVELVAAANAYEGRTDQSGWLMLEQAVWKNRAQSTRGRPSST